MDHDQAVADGEGLGDLLDLLRVGLAGRRVGRQEAGGRVELGVELAAAEQPRRQARVEPHALQQERPGLGAVHDQELEPAGRAVGGEIAVHQHRGLADRAHPRAVRDLEQGVDGERGRAAVAAEVRDQPRRRRIGLARQQHGDQIGLGRLQAEAGGELPDRRRRIVGMIVDQLGADRRAHQPIDLLRPERGGEATVGLAAEEAVGPALADRALEQAAGPDQVIVVAILLADQERDRAGGDIVHGEGQSTRKRASPAVCCR